MPVDRKLMKASLQGAASKSVQANDTFEMTLSHVTFRGIWLLADQLDGLEARFEARADRTLNEFKKLREWRSALPVGRTSTTSEDGKSVQDTYLYAGDGASAPSGGLEARIAQLETRLDKQGQQLSAAHKQLAAIEKRKQ